jgi:hypothetical protein
VPIGAATNNASGRGESGQRAEHDAAWISPATAPDRVPVEQFAAAGPEPAFHHRVHPGHPDAAECNLDAGVGEDRKEVDISNHEATTTPSSQYALNLI